MGVVSTLLSVGGCQVLILVVAFLLLLMGWLQGSEVILVVFAPSTSCSSSDFGICEAGLSGRMEGNSGRGSQFGFCLIYWKYKFSIPSLNSSILLSISVLSLVISF